MPFSLLSHVGDRNALGAGAPEEGGPDGPCEARRLVQGQRLAPEATNRASHDASIREVGEDAPSRCHDPPLHAEKDQRGSFGDQIATSLPSSPSRAWSASSSPP